MTKDQTAEGKRAAADAAKKKATEAKQAADAAGGTDEALNTAAQDAQAEADRLETEAAAPSHEPKPGHKGPGRGTTEREKEEKRMEILLSNVNKRRISEGLKPLSLEEYKEDPAGTDPGEDDDDAPVTRRELRRMGIVRTAEDMTADIEDTELKGAVDEALKMVSKDIAPEKRYEAAMAIVSAGKNTRVAQEAQRMGHRRPQTRPSGGNPAREEGGAFVPTAQEAMMMKKFKLSEKDVLDSRKAAQEGNFGQ